MKKALDGSTCKMLDKISEVGRHRHRFEENNYGLETEAATSRKRGSSRTALTVGSAGAATTAGLH